jgi:hypothetical protein
MITESWSPSFPITAACATNKFGGTDVSVLALGVKLETITYNDYDVDKEGFDGLKLRIEGTVLELIADALQAAS